jgi:bifunctional non-homologous end joining protein LigD
MMPRHVKPMLATAVTKAFDHPDWLFEIKWDGFRAIAEVDQTKVRLYSRKHLSFEDRFPAIVNSLKTLGHEAVLDGEVVVLDETGRPQFQLLQNFQKAGKGTLVYQVFDLLYLNGHDLQNLPLRRRKELLVSILDELRNVRLSEHIPTQGVAFFKAVSEKGLEGIVAKDAGSRYRQGIRSRSWLKIKTDLRQDAVIAGFTAPKGSRKGFGALLLGVFAGEELLYIGHVGSGFTETTLTDLRAKLEPLIQKACPFKQPPQTNAPAQWVRPNLVSEISFAGWSEDGHMRHPVYVGLREDKSASDVRREVPEPLVEMLQKTPAEAPRQTRGKAVIKTAEDIRPKRPLVIGGRSVALTNLDKVFWPQEGFRKGNLIEYYRQIAGVILPYLRDRPLSLRRHPNGIEGKSFFQKDVTGQPPPDWVQTVLLSFDSGEQKTIRAVLCQDEATLIYLANLGCIELHPWSSRMGSLDRPDYVILDLDPEDIAFDQVIEAAQQTRKVLEQAGAEGYCKTSGQRGLHIYVPFGGRYPFEQAKQFAELIVRLVHKRLPGSTSLIRQPAKRQKRVYLDYLQNGKGKTVAAPYSLRAYPGAPVSTPLRWTEVKRGLDPSRYTIWTLPKRLEKIGDSWAPVLGQGIDLHASLERLAVFLKKASRKQE